MQIKREVIAGPERSKESAAKNASSSPEEEEELPPEVFAGTNSHPLDAWGSKRKPGEHCTEGDSLYQFEIDHSKECKAFTKKEWTQPFTSWSNHLTRWCKMFHSHGEGMHRDGCYAQECIANKDPVQASKMWWSFMNNVETAESRASEAKYCWVNGFCADDHPLGENSTVKDAENYCDTHIKGWREFTPFEWLQWMMNGFGLHNVKKLTCSWGTLHCDVTRCKKYLCTKKWKAVVDKVGDKIRPFL
jgi:hypothetical protein